MKSAGIDHVKMHEKKSLGDTVPSLSIFPVS